MRHKHIQIAIPAAGLLLVSAVILASRPHPNVQQSTAMLPAVLSSHTSSTEYSLALGKKVTSAIDTQTQTKRLTIPITIRNKSQAELQISPGLQMFVLNDRGTPITATAIYLSAGVQVGGTIPIDGQLSQDVDFQIPADYNATSFRFQYDASTLSEVAL